ncbi:MAG TPA: EVE domain-containing protein [Actinomycetota bacterium]|nr:EVE domain-containing protein [Actinomycetota bacterium]
MAYWLMKTEPGTFGIEDLARKKREHWDGVRNYQARNNMMAMKAGDGVLFYHSNAKPSGVAGLAEVVREAYPDHTGQDPSSKYFDPKASPENPIWMMVDVGYVETFPRVVSLAELKQTPGLEAMAVLRKGSRLSVTPVTQEEFEIICDLGRP